MAAQNCRKRKLDQIMGLQTEVDSMFSEKGALEAEYNHMMMLREMARNKYSKLYHLVLESSSSRQQFFELTASSSSFSDKSGSSSSQQQQQQQQQMHINPGSTSHYNLGNNTSSVQFNGDADIGSNSGGGASNQFKED